MEDLQRTGKAKAIGVCNLSEEWMERILNVAQVVPAINQGVLVPLHASRGLFTQKRLCRIIVELHPFLPQTRLVDYCHSEGIAMEAYSPLGSSFVPLSDPHPVPGQKVPLLA
jgi:glycerol 2-dehydrogenase (NADP+)